MTTTSVAAPAADVAGVLTELCRRWGACDLTEVVKVSFSARLTHNFGHCSAETGRVTIASRLLDFPAVFAEVLVHEAAHVEVWRRHGPHVRSHGGEWRALMEQAGYTPRRCLPPLPGDPPTRRRTARSYLHRCPVCAAQRVGGRPVRHWRCVACHAAGRNGILDIIRLA